MTSKSDRILTTTARPARMDVIKAGRPRRLLQGSWITDDECGDAWKYIAEDKRARNEL